MAKKTRKQKNFLTIGFRMDGNEVKMVVDFVDGVSWQRSIELIGTGINGMLKYASMIGMAKGMSEDEVASMVFRDVK